MDIHPHTPHKEHEPLLAHHKATWHGVTRMALYGTIGIVIVLVLMATFLVHRTVG